MVAFLCKVVSMNFFASPAPFLEPLPVVCIKDRLAEAHIAFRKSEIDLVDADQALARYGAKHEDRRAVFIENTFFTQVSAMFSDPIRRQLEKARDEAVRKRDQCLNHWSELKLLSGG